MEGAAPQVRDKPDESRYEIHVDGTVAGFAAYKAKPGLIAFTHTEVGDAFEGQGLGSKLVSGALEDARARGLAVLPFCPFVNSYIQRHPEHAELVPAEHRGRFEL